MKPISKKQLFRTGILAIFVILMSIYTTMALAGQGTGLSDADNDGIEDVADRCPNTPANTAVDRFGCTLNYSMGVRQLDSNSAEFYVDSQSWADVHYWVNSGNEQAVRMTSLAIGNRFTAIGLKSGDILSYSFTYLDNVCNCQTESKLMAQLITGSPSTSSKSSIFSSVSYVTSSSSTISSFASSSTRSSSSVVSSSTASVVSSSIASVSSSNGASVLGGVCSADARITTPNSLTANAPMGSSDGYIKQLPNGDVLFSNTISSKTHTSYLFLQINGVLYRETPTITDNNDGTYTHSYVRSGSKLSNGDVLQVRFVAINEESIFTPALPAVVPDVPFVIPWSNSFSYLKASEVIQLGQYLGGNYLAQLPNGDVAFCHKVSFASSNDISQLFFRINGVQQASGSTSVSRNVDGTYNHTYIHKGSAFKVGDKIDVRFYVVKDGAGIFIPGPTDTFWSNPITYGAGFNESPFVGIVANPNPIVSSMPENSNPIVPLYEAATVLEPAIVFDRGDAIVTRFADRARDRHAREDIFHKYDHYLPHYWEHRTARYQIADFTSKGGNKLEVKYITEWTLNAKEFRAFYSGEGGTQSYHDGAGAYTVTEQKGRFDDNFNFIDSNGNQRMYSVTLTHYYPLRRDSDIPRDENLPLEAGQLMEFESSLFLDRPPIGRDNYYATTFLYQIGAGGLLPWYAQDFGKFDRVTPLYFKPTDPDGERENSHPIDKKGWLGGITTLPYMYSDEPDNHFMQMSTNLSSINGQEFVLGRRIFHTAFDTGEHDESAENGIFEELSGKSGTHYVNRSCSSCHARNGRALVAENGVPLTKWVFKVGGANGQPDPKVGSVLQPNHHGISDDNGEGRVAIDHWNELGNGLRSPVYRFEKAVPALFSARIAPQLVGLGLLDAVSETDILAWEDENDLNGDGISGKAQKSIDPVTGQTRLGRFGWKAGTSSVKHQIATALNGDMGVMTSLFPNPDCGTAQTNCGKGVNGALADKELNTLTKYISLLGVRARRDLDDQQALVGEARFAEIGCGGCHRDTLKTSVYAPLAELRNQTIHPYTDLLLHDMGPGLADNLGEGRATGAEWRTAPLWGVGLSKSVTEGVNNDRPDEFRPGHGFLHDGRARTLKEAILWHGGEAQAAQEKFMNLTLDDQAALLKFLESL